MDYSFSVSMLNWKNRTNPMLANMLKKLKYIESPIESLQLEKTFWKGQKRNGYIFCTIKKSEPLIHTTQTKTIDYTLYVLKGSISYQQIYEGQNPAEWCKETALEITSGEYVFLPAGSYYFWIGSLGVEYVIVADNLPNKIFDLLPATNINL